jgi:hypothetical protein
MLPNTSFLSKVLVKRRMRAVAQPQIRKNQSNYLKKKLAIFKAKELSKLILQLRAQAIKKFSNLESNSLKKY